MHVSVSISIDIRQPTDLLLVGGVGLGVVSMKLLLVVARTGVVSREDIVISCVCCWPVPAPVVGIV